MNKSVATNKEILSLTEQRKSNISVDTFVYRKVGKYTQFKVDEKNKTIIVTL